MIFIIESVRNLPGHLVFYNKNLENNVQIVLLIKVKIKC